MKTALRWLAFALGAALGVTELVGLATDAPISGFVWDLPWWGRLLVGGFCAWMALHFGFRILPRPKDREAS